jgi:hypothetical protein
MRIIALVFAFALCAGAFAAYTPNRKMSSVLAQVQSLLQTGGPAQNVFDLLDGITEDVRKEQSAHDALHATHQAQCSEELEFRTGEVATAQDAFDRSVAQATKCQTSLSRAEASLESNLHNQEETRQAIAEKDRIRREEAALYATRVQQKHEADQAVDEGLRLLDELALGQASLLQVSNAAANMIRKGVSMRQTGAFAPAIAALAQVASTDVFANPDAVERVRELLFQVKEQIQAAFDAYTQAENSAIELYTQTRAALVHQLEDLEAEEQTLRGHIADMNVCLVEEAAVQVEATNKRNRNDQLLHDATNMCDTYFQQYTTATEGRNDELRVIAQLKAIVQQRFSQMTSGAYHRADQDVFDEHVNDSVYHDDDYVKNYANYNAQGAEQVGYNRNYDLERMI